MLKKFISFVSVLCLLLIVSASVYSANVIVAYDYSASMCGLRKSGVTFMTSDDINRLNDYLTHLIYAGRPNRESISPVDYEISSKIGLEPLYDPNNRSDRLSFFKFHGDLNDILSMQGGISQTEFEGQLPEKCAELNGMDSHIYKAELHIHELADRFYESSHSKQITYGIMVSDYDVDRSEPFPIDPEVLRKLSDLNDKYGTRLVYHLLVNRRVQVKVFRLTPEDGEPPPPKDFFIASDEEATTPAKEVWLTRAEDGVLESDPLFVRSADDLTASFQPQELIMSFGEGDRKRFQLDPQKLLPQSFQIELPADSIDPIDLERGVTAEFQLHYKFNGTDHTVEMKQSLILTSKNFFIATDKEATTPAKEIELTRTEDGRWKSASLFVCSADALPDLFEPQEVIMSLGEGDRRFFQLDPRVPLPQSFHIELPADSLKKITTAEFQLRYRLNGEVRTVPMHSLTLKPHFPENFFISSDEEAKKPVKEIDLAKTEDGKWLRSDPLFVCSADALPESFKPQEVIMIFGEGDQKRPFPLDDAGSLPQGFRIKLPADSMGCEKGVKEVNVKFLLGYNLEGTEHTVPIKQSLTLRCPPPKNGGGNLFLIILLIIIGLAIVGLVFLGLYLLRRRREKSRAVSFVIEAPSGAFKKESNYILYKDQKLGLGREQDPGAQYDYTFDVESPNSFLQNRKGRLDLVTPEGRRTLAESDEFTVVNERGEIFRLRVRASRGLEESEKEEVFSEGKTEYETTDSGKDDRLSQI